MVCSNILEAVGHTPMVRLSRMVPADCAEVLVKFEGLNVGGSIKTRTALNMVEDADRSRYHYRRTNQRQSGHRPCTVRRGKGLYCKDHHAGFGFRGAPQARAALRCRSYSGT